MINQSVKYTAIPVTCLDDIKNDIEKFKNSYELNNFQNWIVNERYITEIKGADFDVKSIVIAVAGYRMFNAVFRYGGKQVIDIIGYPAINLTEYMTNIFNENGHKIDYVHWMPQKRLAVRSGLVEYGRNNICFDKDYGSFIGLATFISDMPPENYTWRESRNSDNCTGCSLCVDNCPTGAMTENRFLINTDKCLSAINEWGTHDFAEWIPKTAHHRLVGCLRCQDICPMNKNALSEIRENLEFSEAETESVLSGTIRDEFADKIKRLDVHHSWESVPRNLRAMFNNPDISKKY